MNYRLYYLLGVLFISGFSVAQLPRLTIVVKTVPATTFDNSAIYVAGNFNGWKPDASDFKLAGLPHNKDSFAVTIPVSVELLEFKLTKGSWQTVETDSNGNNIPNRVIRVKTDTTIRISIAGWQDDFKKGSKMTTASKNVHIIDSAFYMPELKRYRRIWVYLPTNYESAPAKRYPVLYMQDGQNLFDESTAFAGEWGVDEFLDSTKLASCIVVGIDNGGEKRINEYNPYDHPGFGKGEGKAYVDFLVKTLKPFIDQRFRTLTGAPNTIIAGSSMGGLISMYAILKYPGVFGKAGIFSPAFWLVEKDILKSIKLNGSQIKGKLYFYAGGLEGKEMVPGVQKVVQLLQQYPPILLKTRIKKTGRHNEAEWQKQFPVFYRWVMR